MATTITLRQLGLSIFAGIASLFPDLVHAQIGFGGEPIGLTPGASMLAPLRSVELPSIDLATLLAEDEANLQNGGKGPYRFGFQHVVDLDMASHGSWTTLRNGDRVWRLGITCPGALGINFIFSEFVVPEGGVVFVYNDLGQHLGGFTGASNGHRSSMGVSPLPGEHITIEYHEPLAHLGEGRSHISKVTHGYRDPAGVMRDLGDSGDCNINVICPEGDEWRDQIRATALVITPTGTCTGTLLNNCAEDGTPYFLTANHCLDADVANWTFRFNWDSPICDPTEDGPTDQTVSGCELLVNSAGTDLALLRLNTAPPEEYNAFYSGWDHSDVAATSMTGIHHPRGDIKKISHSNGPAVVGTFSGADCWQVQLWDAGTTEPGSSGSGLWNQNKQLVGQLFGGAANCTTSVNDYYGRLTISWPLVEEWLGATCGDTLGGLGGTIIAPIVFDGAVTSITNVAAINCGVDSISPNITYKNNGTIFLTSALFTYWIEGGPTYSYPWTGSLDTSQTVNISLPAIPLLPGENILKVVCGEPNGGQDQATANDTLDYAFNASLPSAIISLILTLDNYGEDILWDLSTDNGTELYSGGPYPNNHNGQVDSIPFCLTNGCYVFTIHDAFGNGLCCDDGEGSYVIRDLTGEVHAESDGQYGDINVNQFCFVRVSVAERFTADHIRTVPNPSTGIFALDLSTLEGTVRYQVTDMVGRTVREGSFVGGNARASLDLCGESTGVYHLALTSGKGRFLQRVMVVK